MKFFMAIVRTLFGGEPDKYDIVLVKKGNMAVLQSRRDRPMKLVPRDKPPAHANGHSVYPTTNGYFREDDGVDWDNPLLIGE